MTGSHRDHALDDLDVLAYADGLLDSDPAWRDEVERRLRASPELAARVEAYRAQSAALRRAYGARAGEPVPERLLAALERPSARPGRRAAAIAAVLALTVCAGAAGWLLGRGGYPDGGTEREFVARSYQDYVAHEKKINVARPGQAEPLNWLSRKISLTLRAPDLTGQGYSLVDARAVDRGARSGMVRLTYADKDGQGFSLFLHQRWQAKRREDVRLTREDGVSLAYWLDGPLASVIASRLPPEEILAVSKAVRRALNDPDVTRPELAPAQEPASQSAGNIAAGAAPSGNGAMPPREPVVPGPVKQTPGVIAN